MFFLSFLFLQEGEGGWVVLCFFLSLADGKVKCIRSEGLIGVAVGSCVCVCWDKAAGTKIVAACGVGGIWL